MKRVPLFRVIVRSSCAARRSSEELQVLSLSWMTSAPPPSARCAISAWDRPPAIVSSVITYSSKFIHGRSGSPDPCTRGKVLRGQVRELIEQCHLEGERPVRPNCSPLPGKTECSECCRGCRNRVL